MAKPMITLNNVFYWNLSQNVGRGSPNQPDDVELVRYGYFCMGERAANQSSPIIPLIKNMQKTGGYGPDLQAVIDAHQADRGGTRDGHVSSIRANFTALGQGSRYDGTHTFIMVVLNNNMIDRDSRWPRIDFVAETGPTITATAKAAFAYL